MPQDPRNIASLAKFKADLKKFAVTVDLDVQTVIKKISFDLFTRIVKATPADTGNARANWNIASGTPDNGTIEFRGGGASATSHALSKLDTVKVGRFETVFITNNLPYIVRLENGHSQRQAPRGMVAISVQAVNAGISDII